MTPPGNDWHDWMHRPFGAPSPYEYEFIEVWRDGWDKPSVQRPSDNPMMNAVGLFWRPVRHQAPGVLH